MDGNREISPECNRRSNEEIENTPGGQKWDQIIKKPENISAKPPKVKDGK